MEAIVNNIPATTPVAVLNLGNNTLTRIPANLPQYKQLQTLIISKNQITSVGANQLTLPANVTLLDLSSNQITKIETNSFPGKIILLKP
jgi:Leucine-rich repeat (LRR) protein